MLPLPPGSYSLTHLPSHWVWNLERSQSYSSCPWHRVVSLKEHRVAFSKLPSGRLPVLLPGSSRLLVLEYPLLRKRAGSMVEGKCFLGRSILLFGLIQILYILVDSLCLIVLSASQRKVMKSPTLIENIFIFPFNSICFAS